MKYKKKLVEPKDYVIANGTEDESGNLAQFSNVVTMDGFNPPSKLVKAKSESDEDFDVFSVEKLEKKYFKGQGFITVCMSCVGVMLEDRNKNINVFVVIRNKVFKYYSKAIVKKFSKLFDVNFDFVYVFKEYDDMKKLLRKDLTSDQLDDLKSRLHKLEHGMTDKKKDNKKKDDKKKDKHKKDKDKDKDKKKKKKKKKGLEFKW
jgi:hypothetical protein